MVNMLVAFSLAPRNMLPGRAYTVKYLGFHRGGMGAVAAPGQGAPGQPPWHASAPPWLSPWLGEIANKLTNY